MRARIVIGANFGDESKGLIVDYLCHQGAGIVVRFNGGANAGHTVVTKDKERHVFRHFGSGSLLNVPTYLSQFFVCNPILFFIELEELRALGFHPEVYAHPDCLITTFADMMINQHKERSRDLKRHGSCGVGVHETITRSKLDEIKITLGDLWNGWKLRDQQMDEICGKWMEYRTGLSSLKDPDNDATIEKFISTCMDFAAYVQPLGINQVANKDPVFEGAQGLLLSQDNKEFKPHLTHSYTGMRNPTILCEQAGIKSADVYYVSRTYLTRHGAGPLPGEDGTLSYEDDTNRENEFQGKLRFAPLDPKSLLERCNNDVEGGAFKLVLTHCDQCDPPKGLDAALFSDGPQRENVIAGPIV